jgi:cell wall assembly regulator SMI1
MNSTDLLRERLVLQLCQHWQPAMRARLRAPAPRREIEAFEETYNVTLPAEFAAYLECFDGFNQDDDNQDDTGFNFWPIAEICPVGGYDGGKYRFPSDEKYFLFCDYLDFCWAYAISFETSNIVMVGTNSGKPIPVADSFAEFVSMYIRDDAQLYPPLAV